jgi:hydroxymethylpyrimidine/phosphomethylpyrimidine kinase
VKETTHQSPGARTTLIAIGGLDSSGGAGLVRDHLTGAALGAQMVLVGTAWTLQSGAGVTAVDPRPPDHLQHASLTALGAAGDAGGVAVKIGMVANEAQAGALLAALERFAGAVVFDPVRAASIGGRLFQGDPSAVMPLLRRATLVTPNLMEAEALAGQSVGDAGGALVAARLLVAQGARGVLVKGGHLRDCADDSLVWRPPGAGPPAEEVFRAARIAGASPRGTGCALATAIAVGLAAGAPLPRAVVAAKTWLRGRIAAAAEVAGERHL